MPRKPLRTARSLHIPDDAGLTDEALRIAVITLDYEADKLAILWPDNPTINWFRTMSAEMTALRARL